MVVLLATVYYLSLSKTSLVFGLLCLAICYIIESYIPAPLWLVCVMLFVAVWIGQFYGHKVEGKKPSFLKDLQFLMIGPMWLMSFIYGKMGIKF